MFENEINRAIINSDEAYKSMKYRDALSYAFHILESSRDYYRTHVPGGSHKCLIERCIHVQLVLLAPICPHFCEEQKQKYAKEFGFESKYIVNEAWPQLSQEKEDFVLTQQFEFINDTSHRFRQLYRHAEDDREKKFKKLENSKNKQNDIKEYENEFDSAILCVAADYKAWQKATLHELATFYQSKTDEMANDFTRKLSQAQFIQDATKGLSKKGKKAYIQKVMQFANWIVKEILPIRKQQAFNQSLLFNEFEFAKTHLPYLFHDIKVDVNTIQVFRVKWSLFCLEKCAQMLAPNMFVVVVVVDIIMYD